MQKKCGSFWFHKKGVLNEEDDSHNIGILCLDRRIYNYNFVSRPKV